MVSKSQIKLIKSLSQKKYRNKHQLFVVEGKKGVLEFLNSSFELYALFSLEEFNEVPADLYFSANEDDLKRISFLKTAPDVVAIFKINELTEDSNSQLKVVLDGVRDPGNLGTIIRLCDWFGIKELLCSHDTVDCFNPKVVQASMGSLTRVSVKYVDLIDLFKKNTDMPVFGTLLEGENIYSGTLQDSGFLVLGNEANGISEEVKHFITNKITIPQFGEVQNTESLNVATATAIALSEFKRAEFIGK